MNKKPISMFLKRFDRENTIVEAAVKSYTEMYCKSSLTYNRTYFDFI